MLANGLVHWPVVDDRLWETTYARVSDDAKTLKVGFGNVMEKRRAYGFTGIMGYELRWPRRLDMFASRLKSMDHDVFGFTNIDHFNDFWSIAMMRDYTTLYTTKDGDSRHGVMLVVRRQRFRTQAMVQVFHDVAAIAVLLYDHESGQMLCVCVTHLEERDLRRAKKVVREKQLRIVLERIQPLIDEADHTIFMGTLNTVNMEDPIIRHLEDERQWCSVPMLWTTWYRRIGQGKETCSEDDFIFVSSSAAIIRYLCTPSNDVVKRNGLLPGRNYPSDHLLLDAEVALESGD
jgi:hypothetical protein